MRKLISTGIAIITGTITVTLIGVVWFLQRNHFVEILNIGNIQMMLNTAAVVVTVGTLMSVILWKDQLWNWKKAKKVQPKQDTKTKVAKKAQSKKDKNKVVEIATKIDNGEFEEVGK